MKKIVLFSAFLFSVALGMAQYGNNGYGNGHHGNNGHHPQYGGNTGYNHGAIQQGPVTMTPQEFQRARTAVSRQSFDRDKLTLARQIAQSNLMLSNQVRQLTELMSFESSRLEFAKFAYDRVIDPERYYVVNEAFRFSSSVRELDRYISTATAYSPIGGCAAPTTTTTIVHGQNGSTTYSGGMTVTSGHGGIGINHGAAPAPGPGCGACQGHHMMDHMCPVSFSQLINAIEKQCFDSDKMLIAKQGIRGKMVSAEQVLRIMGLLTFESGKLEFAKFAYLNTWNRGEYYIVNDGFTFSSSVRELDRYIRSVG